MKDSKTFNAWNVSVVELVTLSFVAVKNKEAKTTSVGKSYANNLQVNCNKLHWNLHFAKELSTLRLTATPPQLPSLDKERCTLHVHANSKYGDILYLLYNRPTLLLGLPIVFPNGMSDLESCANLISKPLISIWTDATQRVVNYLLKTYYESADSPSFTSFPIWNFHITRILVCADASDGVCSQPHPRQCFDIDSRSLRPSKIYKS